MAWLVVWWLCIHKIVSSSLGSNLNFFFLFSSDIILIILFIKPNGYNSTNTTFSHFLFVPAAWLETDGVRMINEVKCYEDGMGRTPRKSSNAVSLFKILTSDRSSIKPRSPGWEAEQLSTLSRRSMSARCKLIIHQLFTLNLNKLK